MHPQNRNDTMGAPQPVLAKSFGRLNQASLPERAVRGKMGARQRRSRHRGE